MILFIQIIQLLATLITWLVIVHVILSYFMSPYHPVRQFISSVLEPMLSPIRRVMPSTGMIDFSPLILIILVQLIEFVLISLVRSL